MKYKHKKTGEIISKRLFDDYLGDLPELFDPVYEVGEYYSYFGHIIKITKVFSHPDLQMSVAEYETLTGGEIGNKFGFKTIFSDALIYLTPEQAKIEIDKATKKFPFTCKVHVLDYEIDNYGDHIKIKCLLDNHVVFLDKSAWQKIGEEKGWIIEKKNNI